MSFSQWEILNHNRFRCALHIPSHIQRTWELFHLKGKAKLANLVPEIKAPKRLWQKGATKTAYIFLTGHSRKIVQDICEKLPLVTTILVKGKNYDSNHAEKSDNELKIAKAGIAFKKWWWLQKPSDLIALINHWRIDSLTQQKLFTYHRK